MRTEALFFKTLFLVFVSFYFSSLMIWLFLFVVSASHFSDVTVMLGAAFGMGLISSLLFSPVLLLICFIQWGIMNKWLKNVISFVLMIVYGFCLIFIIFSDSYNKPWNHPLFEIFDYFLLSVPATLIFLIILFYLTKRSIRP